MTNDLESLLKRMDELEKKVETLSKIVCKQPSTPVSKIEKPLSAKEFLLTKKVSSSTQKTLLLCSFLESHMGLTSFNTADVENVFRQAKEPVPKNINDMINKNIIKGLLMESGEPKDNKKAWTLTSSGETFVQDSIKNK